METYASHSQISLALVLVLGVVGEVSYIPHWCMPGGEPSFLHRSETLFLGGECLGSLLFPPLLNSLMTAAALLNQGVLTIGLNEGRHWVFEMRYPCLQGTWSANTPGDKRGEGQANDMRQDQQIWPVSNLALSF